MKRLLILLAFSIPAYAHPGVGVVIDSRGNVFYTDLEQVWRIDPTGAKSVAVPNVHTHELYLDASDNLYGEHLWYNGDALKTWGRYVWRRTPSGRVETAVPTREAFQGVDFSFVRDRLGNAYWIDRERNTILKCSSACVPVTAGRFADIRWITVTPRGTLYVVDLVDLVDLVRISADGRKSTLARNLSRKREKHQVMGVWTDRTENVYVADSASGVVKRIDERGRVEIVARSKFPWSPTGGVFAPNGDLLILEYMIGPGDVARVHRVSGICCRRY